MKVSVHCFLFILAVSPFSSLGQTPAKPLKDAAERIASDEIPPAAGVALAQVNEDRKNFGSAGLLRKEGPKIDENTLFEIGSITKVFTGILLADAVLREKATLETTLAEVFGNDLSDDSAIGRITLKELTTHTSGLPSFPKEIYETENYDPLDPFADFDDEDLMAYLNQFTEGQFEDPGKYSYSNLGVGTLGIALERLSGKPFEELLKEVILKPLEMNDTFVQRRPGFIPDSVQDRYATGHDFESPTPHWHINALCAAGAMVSSASDLSLFAEAHWSSETPEPLRAAMNLAAQAQTDKTGLGWHIRGERIFHSGGTGGFRTSLFITPNKKSAKIDLRNSTGIGPTAPEGDLSRFAGFWTGTLDTVTNQLPLILRIQKNGTVFLYSLSQTGAPILATQVKENENLFRFGFAALNGVFSGERTNDVLSGTWKQVEEYPLELTRSPELPSELREYLDRKVRGNTQDLAGYWSGMLGGENGIFLILHLESLDGTLDPKFYSPDQTTTPINVTALTFTDKELELSVEDVKGFYEATLIDEETMDGKWNQVGVDQPLTLKWSEDHPERPERSSEDTTKLQSE